MCQYTICREIVEIEMSPVGRHSTSEEQKASYVQNKLNPEIDHVWKSHKVRVGSQLQTPGDCRMATNLQHK